LYQLKKKGTQGCNHGTTGLDHLLGYDLGGREKEPKKRTKNTRVRRADLTEREYECFNLTRIQVVRRVKKKINKTSTLMGSNMGAGALFWVSKAPKVAYSHVGRKGGERRRRKFK